MAVNTGIIVLWIFVRRCLQLFGTTVARSLVPLLALVLIIGTTYWGPWVTAIAAYGSWRLAGWIA